MNKELVLVNRAEGCCCSVSSDGTSLGDIAPTDMGQWIPCPHGSTARKATPADFAEGLGLTAESLSRAAIYANNDGLRTRELVEEGCEDPLTQEWPAYCDADEGAFYAAEELVREASE